MNSGPSEMKRILAADKKAENLVGLDRLDGDGWAYTVWE